MLIFPHYNTSNIEPKVRKLPPEKLPKAILESVMGKDAPATVFKEFLSMANKAKIHFCEIEFSDGVAAANEIYQYVKSMG